MQRYQYVHPLRQSRVIGRDTVLQPYLPYGCGNIAARSAHTRLPDLQGRATRQYELYISVSFEWLNGPQCVYRRIYYLRCFVSNECIQRN